MATKKNSLNTRMFIEGYEVDLIDDISITTNYEVMSVKDISKKSSAYTNTISIPGSTNNNKLFNFFFDVKSTGNSFIQPDGYTARVSNNIPGLSVNAVTLLGNTFNAINGTTLITPITNGHSQTSFHYELDNVEFSVEVSGNTAGWVVFKLNGIIINTNYITSTTNTYIFPVDKYYYTDVLEIEFQTTYQPFSGNIGYNFDFRKKARTYVIQDNQIVLSGYAKMVSATTVNGLISYQMQITSDLGGFTAALANLRLEDLYTATGPDLDLDPTGNLSEVFDLVSPYDHLLTIPNIQSSWSQEVPYCYPLIDYGGNSDSKEGNRSDTTVNHTNFFTSVLRPCLYAKNYIDLIFDYVGYTYDSNFLNSTYFKNLIIPYKDGNFTLIDTYPVEVTTVSGTTLSYNVPYAEGPEPGFYGFYIFNEIVSDVDYIYDVANTSYPATWQGVYEIATNLTVNFTFAPTVTNERLLSPALQCFVVYQVYNSAGTLYNSTYDYYNITNGQLTFDGVAYFAGNSGSLTTDNVTLNFGNSIASLVQMNEGDYLKIWISISTQNDSPNVFEYLSNNSTYSDGTITVNILESDGSILTDLQIGRSSLMDGQWIRYKDFVPKSIQCKDFLSSIIQLFNLYPVQDQNIPNHFYIYTRDEFFSNQETLDWTDKLDINSPVVVTPVPALDAQQLLFSYKKATDWWNKEYDSLYGDFSYGSLRVNTGYEFGNQVKDVLKGTIFSPTPSVQYSPAQILSEGTIEILNSAPSPPGPADVSNNIMSSSGYNNSTGNFSGTAFTNIKKGVHIVYWGVEYIVDEVFNQYSWSVTNLQGNANIVLIRPLQSNGYRQVNGTYYAEFDTFTYSVNSDVIIPAIYESSDNNATHKPTKTNPRILYFQPLTDSSPTCNPIWLQYTPYLQVVVQVGVSNPFNYYYYYSGTSETRGDAVSFTQYPFCSHIDDPINPTKDLLFAQPLGLFFTYPQNYPTQNLYSRYWVNSVMEMVNEDSRFLECKMKLNSIDISNLDLSNAIAINNTNYRINSISDYTADNSVLTKCEFVKIPQSVQTINPPIVNPGSNQTIINSGTSTTVSGSIIVDSAEGMALANSVWSQVSGPNNAVITTAGNLSTTVTGLIVGTYIFKLTATDTGGNQGSGEVTIVVQARVPCTPSVTASNNGPINIPTYTSATLTGTAEGCNGSTIVSTTWSFVSGPTTPTITNPSDLTTTVTGMTSPGAYIFELLIEDNFGETNNTTTTVATSYKFLINGSGAVYGTPSEACSASTGGPSVYAALPFLASGQQLYSDTQLTTPWTNSNTGNLYYSITDSQPDKYAAVINTSGIVQSGYSAC